MKGKRYLNISIPGLFKIDSDRFPYTAVSFRTLKMSQTRGGVCGFSIGGMRYCHINQLFWVSVQASCEPHVIPRSGDVEQGTPGAFRMLILCVPRGGLPFFLYLITLNAI